MAKEKSKASRKGSKIIDISEAREIKSNKAENSKRKKEENQTLVKGKRKAQSGASKLILLGVILIALVFTSFALVKIIGLKAEEARAKAQNKELAAEKKELQNTLKNVNSAQYIEKKARDDLKMVKKEETLFIFDGDEKASFKSPKGPITNLSTDSGIIEKKEEND